MTADPLHIGRRDEVLGWIDQGHGRGAGMAVTHFAPGVSSEMHARMMERVRGWMKTRKKRAKGGKRGMEAREKAPPGGVPPTQVLVSRLATPSGVGKGPPRQADSAPPDPRDVLSRDWWAMSPMEMAQANVDLARAGLAESRPGTTAYHEGHRALRAVLAEVEELRRKAQEQVDPVTLGAAEWMARSAEDATSCLDDELEVYVSEWLRRRSLSLVHEASGRLALVQVAG